LLDIEKVKLNKKKLDKENSLKTINKEEREIKENKRSFWRIFKKKAKKN